VESLAWNAALPGDCTQAAPTFLHTYRGTPRLAECTAGPVPLRPGADVWPQEGVWSQRQTWDRKRSYDIVQGCSQLERQGEDACTWLMFHYANRMNPPTSHCPPVLSSAIWSVLPQRPQLTPASRTGDKEQGSRVSSLKRRVCITGLARGRN
jgi:hypothetical protein